MSKQTTAKNNTVVATRNESKRDKHATARSEFRMAATSYKNHRHFISDMTDDEFDDFDDDMFGGTEKIR